MVFDIKTAILDSSGFVWMYVFVYVYFICILNSTIHYRSLCVCVCVQPWHHTFHSHLMIAGSHWQPSLLPDQIQLPWTIETSSKLRTPSAHLCCCSLLRDSCWTPNHVEGPQGPQSTPVHTRACRGTDKEKHKCRPILSTNTNK